MNDKQIKAFQAQALADLQAEMAVAESKNDMDLHAWRTALLVSLIKVRQSHKLTQAQLAAKIGTSQSVIARIESGKGNPSLNTLLKLARALGTNLLFYK